MAGQCTRRQADLLLVSLAGSSDRALATPAQIVEDLPHMAAMIPDAELVLKSGAPPAYKSTGELHNPAARALQ